MGRLVFDFASALGRPEWGADSRFRRNSDRVANREILVAEITLVLATRGTDHWIGALHEAGVPCGPILQLDQVFSHEQARSRELAFTLPMTGIGDAPMIANPMRLLQTPPQYHRAPPRFAEHTQEVLHERLGVDENEFLALQERSVVR